VGAPPGGPPPTVRTTGPFHRHPPHGGAGHAAAGAASGTAGAATGAAAGGLSAVLGLLGAIIKWGLIGLMGLSGVAVGAAIVGGVLIFTGSPSPCSDREIVPSSAASQQLRADWKRFEQEATAGRAQITFSEVGVTSRGVEYIDEKNIPLEDLQVHFCPDGLGEATGTIKTPGPDVKVLMRGTLDLSGAKPRIDVRTIKAGNFPGFGTTWILDNVIKKSNADILDIKVPLTKLEISDGSATVTTGAP